MNLIEKTEINTGRQPFLDVAKALTIIYMVEIHVVLNVSGFTYEDNPFLCYYNDLIFGSLIDAPVFMICMGVGMAYSAKNTPEQMIKRGIKLYIIGIIVNVLRAVIPLLSYSLITGNREFWDEGLFELVTIDILHFAGLAFIVTGLLKKLKFNDYHLLFTGLALFTIAQFIGEVNLGNFLLNLLAGNFIGAYDDIFQTEFPFFYWYIFVVIGNLFGKYLRRCSDVKKLLVIAIGISTAILGVTIIAKIQMNWDFAEMFDSDYAFYHMDYSFGAMCVAASFTALLIYYFIAQHLSEKLYALASKTSKYINEIYIVHCVLVAIEVLIVVVILRTGLDMLGFVLSSIAFLIISYKLAPATKRLIDRF